eukprot:CAMPEP_0197290962 /NCGR_PEP_ID=MMETSP0890-20130614/10354_1 /TAXON_ID=44058 ORGANISM="Aureoumbra lagunensis, Strain CCMP1510" /NCGR_SAMPLE_ID=MMETSP0890 /ASSEMBLY_ACC=CAM_ASM_000533 /LENGTH=401 /DNA_ID=CAMNT_0042763373 /DNA_START=40 /DNA_END=1245 /DNA_ORIENTATION=-
MKTLFFVLGLAEALISPTILSVKKSNMQPRQIFMHAEEKAAFAVVGCGMKGRGMGWFHALQLYQGICPSAELTDIVEPWFLGGGKDSLAGQTFAEEVVAEMPQVEFHASIEDLYKKSNSKAKIALIAGRTVDNPTLFRQAIQAGATHILLEKPGAPSVDELQAMANEAKEQNVAVYMGFIKNIASYVTDALQVAQANPGSKVQFISRNDYKREDLAECFSRNSEGLLKNMAIHELALAVQFFGMRADDIASVELEDPQGCECLTLGDHTDFSRLDFTLKNSKGTSVRITVDRCSGDGCAAVVSQGSSELYSCELVDEQKAKIVQRRMAEHPDWLSYLLTQELEYAQLKERCSHAALLDEYPQAVATIDIAIEALKLAEYLTPLLQAKLLNNKSEENIPAVV